MSRRGSGVERGTARGVDVATLEQELRRARLEEAGEGISRACALNLIVVRPMGAAADPADVVAALTADHPCRVFDLALEQDAAAGPRAWVASHCHRPGGRGRQVCCEQVTLAAGADRLSEARALIAALLVTDQPTALWWVGVPPFGTAAFDELASLSDRLIVDSGADPAPPALLRALAAWRGGAPHGPAPGDLEWRRLSAWRGLIARPFDGPAERSDLDRLDTVTLAWPAPAGSMAPAAVYLAAWLVSRLEWRVSGRTPDLLECEAARRRVRIHLEATGASGPCRVQLGMGTRRVTLEAATMHGPVLWSESRPGSDEKRVEATGWIDDVRMLGRELEVPAPDIVYEQALRRVEDVARGPRTEEDAR